MSDEMNKNNEESWKDQSNTDEGSSNQDQYSFWAEQVASNQQGQQTQGTYQGQMEQHIQQDARQNVNFSTMDNNEQNQEQQYQYNQASRPNWTSGYHPNYSNLNGDPYQPYDADPKPKKEHKKAKKVAKILVGAVCAGAIAGACFIGVVSAYNHFQDDSDSLLLSDKGDTVNIASTTVLDSAVVPDTNVTQVYKETLPSIVAIDSTLSETITWFGQSYEQESEGSGSGIIVGQTDTELLIATNNHVVDGSTKIAITFIDGTTAQGITKGTDASADLAVVAIDITDLTSDTLNAIKVASLGNSDDVLEGEMAIAIGNALGYGQSITVGYISAVNRTVEFETGSSMELLQTDAAINPGNSGGALINTNGEVIGINSAKLAADSIEGIGYAIPISYAYPILEELMSREIIKQADQGYLGVKIREITEDIATSYSMPYGVYVVGFTEGSAAQVSGIQERDIITKIEDVEVTTVSALQEKVISYKYGTTITITIQRSVDGEYKEFDYEVTLGRNPEYTDSKQDSKSQDKQTTPDESQGNE